VIADDGEGRAKHFASPPPLLLFVVFDTVARRAALLTTGKHDSPNDNGIYERMENGIITALMLSTLSRCLLFHSRLLTER
jgi:hypothetical protein